MIQSQLIAYLASNLEDFIAMQFWRNLGCLLHVRNHHQKGELMDINSASKYHQYLIITVLVALLSAFFLRQIPTLQTAILLCLWILNVFFCYKLASAIEKPSVLWAVLGLVGFFLIWIPQLLLVNSANKVFKAMGLKIGFLGGATKPL